MRSPGRSSGHGLAVTGAIDTELDSAIDCQAVRAIHYVQTLGTVRSRQRVRRFDAKVEVLIAVLVRDDEASRSTARHRVPPRKLVSLKGLGSFLCKGADCGIGIMNQPCVAPTCAHVAHSNVDIMVDGLPQFGCRSILRPVIHRYRHAGNRFQGPWIRNRRQGEVSVSARIMIHFVIGIGG
jgi:hypothetical protein